MSLGRYGSREIMDFQIFDFATKKPLLTLDYATSAETGNTAETVYARGGSGNPRRISFHGDKETTVTVETQIFTMELLALFAGEKIVSGASEIYKREIVVVQDDGEGGKLVSLKSTPSGVLEDVAVFAHVNGILGESQVVEEISNSDLTLGAASTAEIGDEVEVYYKTNVTTSHKLSFTASGFPPYVFMVGDTVYADEVAGEMVSAQLKYYKAKLQPEFTITNAPTGDPSTLTMTFDVFAVPVDGKDTLYDMIVYEDED